jgi:hypothetical protein
MSPYAYQKASWLVPALMQQPETENRVEFASGSLENGHDSRSVQLINR